MTATIQQLIFIHVLIVEEVEKALGMVTIVILAMAQGFLICPYRHKLIQIQSNQEVISVVHVEVKQHVQFVAVLALQVIMEILIIVLLVEIQVDVNGVMEEDTDEHLICI